MKIKRNSKTAFKLDLIQFAKISAVEGLELSEEMLREFKEFDRKDLSPEERRKEILKKYAKII